MWTSLLLVLSLSTQGLPVERDSDPDDLRWLTAALTAATVYDVETTFRGLANCSGCGERSPVGRWLVKEGRLPTYAAQFALNSGLLLLARSKGGGWTSAAVTIAVGHLIAGTLNLRFVF